MIKILLFILLFIFHSTTFASDKLRLRISLGLFGDLLKYEENDDINSKKNNLNNDNYSITNRSFKIYYVFENGINLGYSHGMISARTSDNQNKTDISTGGVVLGYTFSTLLNISLGTLIYGTSVVTNYTSDGIEYWTKTKPLETKSIYI